jgi:hypothetical protein
MIIAVRLLPREARALTEMCKRFHFDDAQYLLAGARVSGTNLCEAIIRFTTPCTTPVV